MTRRVRGIKSPRFVGGEQDAPLANQLKATREKVSRGLTTYTFSRGFQSRFGGACTSDRGRSFGRQTEHRMRHSTYQNVEWSGVVRTREICPDREITVASCGFERVVQWSNAIYKVPEVERKKASEKPIPYNRDIAFSIGPLDHPLAPSPPSGVSAGPGGSPLVRTTPDHSEVLT